MPLTIVKDDIVRMRVDAIVNSTNQYLIPGGDGVDARIHAVAGPRLGAALREIGYCPLGQAVITESFNIPACKYIIHTAGPTYRGGQYGESEILRSCYHSILSLAHQKDCTSIAIPSISSGAYEYPKEEAYEIATASIRDFLYSLPENEDMMVYLVLYDDKYSFTSDREAIKLGSRDPEENRRPTNYFNHSKKESQFTTAIPAENIDDGSLGTYLTDARFVSLGEDTTDTTKPAFYGDQDLSFAEMCEWWCERKGISKKEFYISSNINKSMFWNMKHHPGQTPRKTNAIACAIGLQLNYEETQDLLMRAGLTLSKYYEMDRIVEIYIKKKEYNIYIINEKLFERDLPLLGAC